MYRFDVRLGEITMQLSQMKERQSDAYNVYDYPENIENVVAKWSVNEGTTWRVVTSFCICSQRTAQKCRSKIYRYAGEPYHKRAKKYALEQKDVMVIRDVPDSKFIGFPDTGYPVLVCYRISGICYPAG